MHDCKGRPLKEGDVVLVPFRVESTSPNDEYCNATLRTLAAMYPSENTSTMIVNTKQTIRANEGDDTSFVIDGNRIR